MKLPFEDKKNKGGKPRAIKSPDELYEWFEKYKAENAKNPVTKMDFKGKDADQVFYEIERPLSWSAFFVWVWKNKGIGISTVESYKLNEDGAYPEYRSIVRVIAAEIFNQQYDGATSGVYQQNIVARRLGLVEKSENKTELTVKETAIGFKKDEK